MEWKPDRGLTNGLRLAILIDLKSQMGKHRICVRQFTANIRSRFDQMLLSQENGDGKCHLVKNTKNFKECLDVI
jgi:hypothetical protein